VKTIVKALGKVLALGLVLASVVGCGSGNKGFDRFIPDETVARKALETALDSWQGGKRPGKITTDAAAIEAMDSKWQAGQQLASYQIVKEEPSNGQGPRWFQVRLTMRKPAGEVTARYVVLGKDPLWVYREEDYKKTSGM
jgi:hypothetical protein